jgi:hypothetical protein
MPARGKELGFPCPIRLVLRPSLEAAADRLANARS